MLGVIGRNGAGKSTLLKLLTRITTPTAGRAEIRGRVGSLLEVGTGFHAELTGRENVYLNGAILGHEAARDQPQARRDRRVRGRGEVHRHAGEALLERDVRAARLLRRRAPRAGDPARRRGARGRRRRVPAPLPRPDGGPRATRAAPCSSSRTTCRRSPSSATARSCSSRAASSATGRARRSSRTTCNPTHGTGSRRAWPDLEAAPGNDLVRLRSVRVVDEDGSDADFVDVRRPVGIEIAFRVLRRGRARDSRRSRCSTARATSPSTRWTRASAGTSRPTPGDYVATAWIPGNLLNEGLTSVDVSVCSLAVAEAAPPRERARRRLLPRPGPRRGRLRPRPLHGPVEGRRPAAARLDDARSAEPRPADRGDVVLVRNEDLYVEQAIRNVAAFCDRIHVADHMSTDGTWEHRRSDSTGSSTTSTRGASGRAVGVPRARRGLRRHGHVGLRR